MADNNIVETPTANKNHTLLTSGKKISTNYIPSKKQPLDQREVVASLAGLAHLLESGYAYNGLIVYVADLKKYYQIEHDYEKNKDYNPANLTVGFVPKAVPFETGYSKTFTDTAGAQVSVDSVAKALDTLFDAVMKNPTITYSTGQTDTNSNFEINDVALDLSEDINISFSFDGSATNNCTIQILRKDNSLENGQWTEMLTQTRSLGRANTINLGKMNTLGDFSYRLYVKDGLGKDAFTPWKDPTSPADAPVSYGYLEFRRWCSEVNFTLPVSPAEQTATYVLDEIPELDQSVSYKAAISGTGYILYKTIEPGQTIPTSINFDEINLELKDQTDADSLALNNNWRIIEIQTPVVGGGPAVSSIYNMYIPKSTTGETGIYTLVSALLIDTGRSKIGSSIASRSLDRLEANALAVTAEPNFEQGASIEVNTDLKLQVYTKTTITDLKIDGGITVAGAIYYDATKVDEKNTKKRYYYCPVCHEIFENSAAEADKITTVDGKKYHTSCYGARQTTSTQELLPMCMFEGRTYRKAVTPGVVSEQNAWNVGRLTSFPDLEDTQVSEVFCVLALTATPSSAANSPIILNWRTSFSLKKPNEQLSYSRDRLVFQLNTLENTNNLTGSLSAPNDHSIIAEQTCNTGSEQSPSWNRLGIKLFNTVKDKTGLVTTTTDPDGACIHLTKNTYGIMYKQDNEQPALGQESTSFKNQLLPYSPFSLLRNVEVDTNGTPLPKGFTFETLIKGIDIGNQEAQLASFRTELFDDAGKIKPNSIETDKGAGINIALDSIKGCVGGVAATYPLMADTWQHLVITVDTTIDESSATDLRPLWTIRYYINGTLVKAEAFNTTYVDVGGGLQQESTFGEVKMLPPLALNGATTGPSDYGSSLLDVLDKNSITVPFNSTGECKIKVLRIYSKALSNQEVFANYLSTCDTDTSKEVLDRNGDKITKIYFSANNLAASSSMSSEEREKLESKLSFYDKKGLKPITFADLHSITKKEDVKDELGQVIKAGSKSALVNCTMYVYHIDTNNNIVWTKFDDVDVFLQGTSSLEYPVKNYKIKGYTYKRNDKGELERKSLKITPPPVDAALFANGEGMPEEKDAWATPAKAYTLKCDYMEHSHRNNTPTACYFEDTVLDTVIASQHIDCKVPEYGTLTPEIKENRRKYYSPARSVVKADNSLPIFRDVINGFPCIVYYAEVGVGGTWEEIPANDKAATQDKLGYNTNCTHRFLPGSVNYTGSYMFNVDKSGDQLGFDISTEVLEKSKQLLTDSEELKLANLGINDIKDTGLKCISYEGGANEDNSAAAFLSFSYKEAAAVETFYNALVSWAAGDIDGLLCTADDASTAGVNEEEFYSLNELTGSEYIISNKQLCRNNNGKAGEVITLAAFAEDLDNNKFKLRFKSGSVWSSTSNSFNYIETTLEPRHSYTEDLEGETEEELAAIQTKTYAPINRAIKWATSIQKAGISGLTTFRKNFEKYFSLDYCLAYYLQMLLFAQVDNAGKNAMFDIWGTDEIFADLDAYNSGDKNSTQKLGKIFPRPYDMDTQMGIDNKGSDRIPVTAELHLDLSPNSVTASDANIIPEGALPQWFVPSYSSKQDTTSEKHRFTYNTSGSYLWKAFGKAYLAEITTAYSYLRDQGVYDVDAICNYVDAMTYYKIGEKFYNDDASIKYLSFKTIQEGKLKPDTTYLKCISGNRRNRYRQFLQQRITFLDSFFGYTTALGNAAMRIGGDRTKRDTFRTRDELSGNKPYNPSAVIADTEVVYAPVGIAVHTPQYVHIEVADGKLINYKVLVEPTDSYTFNGKQYNGALFYIPVVSNQSDKEATIRGIGNISSFNHLYCIAPAKLSIGAASKLVDLDLSNCNRLLAADLTLPNSDKLQQLVLDNTPSLSGSINLGSCSNLVSISAVNSNITTFHMPEKSSLQKLNLQGSSITALTLSNNILLTNENINLMNCNNLSNLAITNCSGIIINDNVVIDNKLSESEKRILGLRKIDSLVPDFYKRARILTLSDCPEVYNLNLSKFNKLNGLYLSNLPKLEKLDLTNNTSSIFIYHPKDKSNYPGLDLSKGLDNLKTIELAGAGTARFTDDEFNAVKLPCIIMDAEGKNYLSKTSLSRLTLANSKIGAITTTKGENKDTGTSGGSSSGNNNSVNTTNFTKGEFNFEAIPGLTELTAYNCIYITTVKNLEYTGSCSSLFMHEGSYDGQSSLTGFENCHFTTKVNTISSMFMRCRKLASLDGLDLTITPNAVSETTVDYLFYYCTNLDLKSIKKVTQQLAKGVTSNGKLTVTRLMQGACTNNQNVSLLPSDFFGTDADALSRIVSLSECFSSSPFKIVPPGFFDKMSNLTNINALFRGSSNLTYIPQNSFYNNKKLNKAQAVFCDCTKLGSLTDATVLAAVKEYDIACMLKPAKDYFTGTEEEKEEKLSGYSSRMFSEQQESTGITDIEGIFYNCDNIDPADGLTGFFANLPNLTNAKFAFYSCASLSKLSKDILKLNKLNYIDGLFMNCGTAETITSWSLPESLFGDGTITVPVKTASGLFAGCTKLTGHVPYNFLKPIASTVEHIGTRVLDRAWSGGSHALLGIFANTKLSSLPNNLLENMPHLQDCSGLIMGYGTSNTTDTYVADNSSFLGFTYLEEKLVGNDFVLTLSDPTSIIPLDFFNASTNKNLTDISYSFAGCSKLTQIEGADPNSLLNPENEIFKDSCKFLPESVNSVAGLFFGCKTLKYVYSNIFKNKQNLKDISYCFTNCALASFDFNLDPFANCTQLAYCNATFMGNTSMLGKISAERGDLFVIPATLFNSCRQQLKEVANMFAGCSSLEGALGVGEVYLNDPATLELNYTALKTATINKIMSKYNTERTAIFGKSRTKNIEQEGLNNDEIENMDDALVETIKQSIINELESELRTALLLAIQDSLGTIQDLDINYLITNYSKIVNQYTESLPAFKINLVSLSDGSKATLEKSLDVPVIGLLGSNYADSSYSEINASWDSLLDSSETKNKTAYLTNPVNKVIDIKQVGLLGDCINLTSVAGMFYNCCKLNGTIPADLFTGVGTNSLPISNMQHMFAGCSYLNTSVSKITYYPIFLPYKGADGTVSFTRYTCKRAANFGSKYPHILPELYTADDGEGNKKGDFKWTTNANAALQTYHIYEAGKPAVVLLTSEINHFLPSDWLTTVDAETLTDISYMFRHIGTLDLNKATEAHSSGSAGYNGYISNLGVEGVGYKGYPLKLTLPDNLFANKFSIQKAVATFHANAVIGKTAISSAFLSASTGSGGLTTIESIFAHSALPGIIADNSSFLGNGCRDLTSIKRAFYYTAMHQLGKNLYGTDSGIPLIDQITNTGLFYGLSSDEIAKLVDFNDDTRFPSLEIANVDRSFVPSTNVVGIYQGSDYSKYSELGSDWSGSYHCTYASSTEISNQLSTFAKLGTLKTTSSNRAHNKA